jgi:shikimate kinase
MVKYLINQRYEVGEADSRREFGKGEKREDYADAWQDTGNVVLVGLRGAGKTELARLLGERTGLEVITPETTDQAVEALEPGGRVVVLDDSLVEHADVQPLIHGAGKVFYLMADTRLLSGRVAGRDSVEDEEGLWREMSARLARMEPVFYSVLHFILQAAQTPEEMLGDALEKIGY